MIDNLPENLSVLKEGGIGLTMLAPHVAFRFQNSVISFNFEQVIGTFEKWTANQNQKSEMLENKQRDLGLWSQTGMNVDRINKILIYFRRVVRNFRKSIVWILRPIIR